MAGLLKLVKIGFVGCKMGDNSDQVRELLKQLLEQSNADVRFSLAERLGRLI